MSGEDAGTTERETVSSINAMRSDPETLTSLNVDKRDEGHDRSDAMAKAISTLLGSVIRDFDARAENAAKSQDQLSAALDRLMSELDKLLEDAPLPFIMQHAAKITGVRKRVSSLNMLLKSIQRRVDNIDRMLSAGISQEKVTTEIIGEAEHSQVLMHEL